MLTLEVFVVTNCLSVSSQATPSHNPPSRWHFSLPFCYHICP